MANENEIQLTHKLRNPKSYNEWMNIWTSHLNDTENDSSYKIYPSSSWKIPVSLLTTDSIQDSGTTQIINQNTDDPDNSDCYLPSDIRLTTNQIVGLNDIIAQAVLPNTKENAGKVAAGRGNVCTIWATDRNENPAWTRLTGDYLINETIPGSKIVNESIVGDNKLADGSISGSKIYTELLGAVIHTDVPTTKDSSFNGFPENVYGDGTLQDPIVAEYVAQEDFIDSVDFNWYDNPDTEQFIHGTLQIRPCEMTYSSTEDNIFPGCYHSVGTSDYYDRFFLESCPYAFLFNFDLEWQQDSRTIIHPHAQFFVYLRNRSNIYPRTYQEPNETTLASAFTEIKQIFANSDSLFSEENIDNKNNLWFLWDLLIRSFQTKTFETDEYEDAQLFMNFELQSYASQIVNSILEQEGIQQNIDIILKGCVEKRSTNMLNDWDYEHCGIWVEI